MSPPNTVLQWYDVIMYLPYVVSTFLCATHFDERFCDPLLGHNP